MRCIWRFRAVLRSRGDRAETSGNPQFAIPEDRVGAVRNQVYRKVPGVRIPFSPPKTNQRLTGHDPLGALMQQRAAFAPRLHPPRPSRRSSGASSRPSSRAVAPSPTRWPAGSTSCALATASRSSTSVRSGGVVVHVERTGPPRWLTLCVSSTSTAQREAVRASPPSRSRRYPSSTTNSSAVSPAALRIARSVPQSSSSCMGTVSGARPLHSRRTWLPRWRVRT